MFFVFLGIFLLALTAGGLYVRRRTVQAAELLGAPAALRKALRWGTAWLLFGYPLLVFVYIAAALALGRESFSLFPSGFMTVLLVYPFWISVLVMAQSLVYFLVFDLGVILLGKAIGRERLVRLRALGCLLVVAVFAIYTPVRIFAEADTLDVHRYRLGEGAGSPLRVVFFADLQRDQHTGAARSREVISAVNEAHPDLILVGGDWINTGPDFIDEAAASAGRLQSRLGTMSVIGDHENFAYRDRERSVREVSAALEDAGVQMMDNELRWIEHEGKRVAIVFLSYNYIYKTPEGEARRLLDQAKEADYSILVTHQFNQDLVELARDRVDLVLAGHTHGSQVNPVVGFMHLRIARLETPFVRGRYRLGERTTVIVTSGIGFSVAPFRYASPASIEVIELRL